LPSFEEASEPPEKRLRAVKSEKSLKKPRRPRGRKQGAGAKVLENEKKKTFRKADDSNVGIARKGRLWFKYLTKALVACVHATGAGLDFMGLPVTQTGWQGTGPSADLKAYAVPAWNDHTLSHVLVNFTRLYYSKDGTAPATAEIQ